MEATRSIESSQSHLVILGGGVCGLYAGLCALKCGCDVTIVEQQDAVGGLARGFKRGENFYDLGVHMLHAFDAEVYNDIAAIMGDARIDVPLDAKIRWAGNDFRYPLKFVDMIKGIPLLTLVNCVRALIVSEIRQAIAPREAKNAEDALIYLYGEPLYKFFFEEFTDRYWGIHPVSLSAEFIRRKMPKLSAVDVFKVALRRLGIRANSESVESALSDEILSYSHRGAETMPRMMADAFVANGGKLFLQSRLKTITPNDGRISEIMISSHGEERTIACDYLLSTIPLVHLITAFGEEIEQEIHQSAARLEYRPIVVYGLLVKKEKCMDGLYTYFRDRVFHRVGEPKNAGMSVTPADHTVLIVEMTCEKNDERWNADPAVLEQVYRDLELERICRKDDIVELHVLPCATGYPIFRNGFEEHYDAVRNAIARFTNLRSTGRQGAFTYPNMHSAMRMGQKAVEEMLVTDSRS